MLSNAPDPLAFPNRNSRRWPLVVLAAVTAAALIGVGFLPRIPQDPAYHQFVDARTLIGVPNFWNVISNAGFLVAGIFGLSQASRVRSAELRPGYFLFCIAIIGVAFGSSWYHYAPSNSTLVWDRLPMSVAFMALFSLVLGDRVSWRLGRTLLSPLAVIGAGSVWYWQWTELHGAGDLRPYGVVQFLPMLLMPLLLLTCPGSRTSAKWLWTTFAGYLLAKVAEHFDQAIYSLLGFSGHSLKHLLGGAAVCCVIPALLALDPARRAAASEIAE